MNPQEKLQAILDAANNTTSAADTDITDAVRTLIDGYGGGGGVQEVFVNKTGASYTRNMIVGHLDVSGSLGNGGERYYGCVNMESVNILLTESEVQNAGVTNGRFCGSWFHDCRNLLTARSSICQYDMFWYCTSLHAAVLTEDATIVWEYAFEHADNLAILVLLGCAVKELKSTNAFTSTPIRTGTGGTGRIYVPAALVDSYKTATNWSAFANSILAIEDNLDVVGDYL